MELQDCIEDLELSGFDCCLVFPKKFPDLFHGWRDLTGVPRGKELWSLSFLAVIWISWKERNSRCFAGAISSVNVW